MSGRLLKLSPAAGKGWQERFFELQRGGAKGAELVYYKQMARGTRALGNAVSPPTSGSFK